MCLTKTTDKIHINPDNAVEKKRSHKGTKTLRDIKEKNSYSFKFNV